jgi:hypothetical protein
MKRAAPLLLLVLGAGCSAAPAGKSAAAAPSSHAPYDAPAAAAHAIDIQIDASAARQILEVLSRPRYDPPDAKLLEDLPAVHLTIQDSTRPAEVFEHDMAAAFEEKSRAAVFDFWTIRQERDRWQTLLSGVVSRQTDLVRQASRRAVALLPGDRVITAKVQIYLSFGLSGLADHLVLANPRGQDIMVIDVARALGEGQGESLDSQISRISRLIAGEAYREAWILYRLGHPAWQRARPDAPPIDQFLQLVAEAGPVALFAVEESFFPLSVWLKDPMKRTLDDMNRHAERFAQAQDNLEARVELSGELRRPEFARQVAGPSGAYLADAVIQDSGLEAFRAALQAGPKGLFRAYDKATQTNKSLIPLSHVIRDRLK